MYPPGSSRFVFSRAKPCHHCSYMCYHSCAAVYTHGSLGTPHARMRRQVGITALGGSVDVALEREGDRVQWVNVLAFYLWRPNPDCIASRWGSHPHWGSHFYPRENKKQNHTRQHGTKQFLLRKKAQDCNSRVIPCWDWNDWRVWKPVVPAYMTSDSYVLLLPLLQEH